MSYIGRSPAYGSAVSQQITGTNSAGPYTLSYDTSTSGVVVSLDGVVQRNSVDFNIAGTALTFTSTVGTGIIINVVFTGLTLSFPTPSDGSVTDAKITAMAASKLTGTIADARFPATLPAASGVNLTALNATNLGSGTVPTARLGTGTASSSTFLRGDQTYAAAGGGKFGQIVVGEDSTRTDIGSTTYTDVGLSVSITPSATSSSVFIMFNMHARVQSDEGFGMKLLRGSTGIWESTTNTHAFQYQANDVRLTPTVFYLDSGISTTSATTYKIQVATMSGKTVDFNISDDKTQIVAIEILA
jgi:hypothetical protein